MEELKKDTQLNINFEEQKQIALKNNILNPNDLVKKGDGKWYIHDIEVEEYNRLMSGNDNSEIYTRKTP